MAKVRNKRSKCRVRLENGEEYVGTIVEVSHQMQDSAGRPFNVYAIQTEDPRARQRGRRYARADEIVARW